jgi:hypothetical protein
MRLISPAFEHGQTIPKQYTEDGGNASPPLKWADVPAETSEFALIVDDPDAPMAHPFVHWVVYRIPRQAEGLLEGRPRTDVLDEPDGAAQGVNSFNQNNIGYRGPAPPQGHGTHHYHFKLYALKDPLEIAQGLSKQSVLDAIAQTSVLAEAELVGTYER